MKVNIRVWRSMSPDDRVKMILNYLPDAIKETVKQK